MSRKSIFEPHPTRRTVLGAIGSAAALAASARTVPGFALARSASLFSKAIPATGEMIPAIGMGTWITFNVGPSRKLRDARAGVLQAFFDGGGGMVDSSPMYGSSEDVIGYCLKRVEDSSGLFSATKVWTLTQSAGIAQMETSEKLWGEDRFDLMQIHNLLDWDSHIETLKEWKAEGRVRYIGITTSHGRRHADFEKLMKELPIDFAQLTYNIADREAENRLLPAAADLGIAVICNRPFRRKALIRAYQNEPLPEWANEIDCANWPQFLLKFIISHPAVTCAIPATTRVDHMRENMSALKGPLPDAKMRERMAHYVEGL